MKKENNYNEIGDANIIIIDAKEEFSYSKSLQFKKRLFSSLSTYKTSNELLELYKPVKKFKPLSIFSILSSKSTLKNNEDKEFIDKTSFTTCMDF